jgi:hypothetical protein
MPISKNLLCAAAMLALCTAPGSARSILFLGSSFTYGAHTAVQYYRPQTVHDLNGPDARGDTYGGVPALFKQFTLEAGLADYDVSSELVGGKGLEYWFTVPDTLAKIQKPWDVVVMHGFSTLDQAHPNDRTLLLSSSKRIAQMFLAQNPKAQLWLFATWSRADMTYPDGTPWHGKPIQQMGKDVEAGYEQAVKEEPRFAGIVPVGLAWNRAIDTGIADDNPYDDIGASKMDLWAYDHYHASVFGYYLEALMDFGRVTGLDPLILLGKDKVAEDIGISPAQSKALIQVAHDTLAASK